jgi:hypothetical protein
VGGTLSQKAYVEVFSSKFRKRALEASGSLRQPWLLHLTARNHQYQMAQDFKKLEAKRLPKLEERETPEGEQTFVERSLAIAK